jgi:hypothetical protein
MPLLDEILTQKMSRITGPWLYTPCYVSAGLTISSLIPIFMSLTLERIGVDCFYDVIQVKHPWRTIFEETKIQ